MHRILKRCLLCLPIILSLALGSCAAWDGGGGWYAPQSSRDVELELIVYTNTTRPAGGFVSDQVIAANNSLRNRGVRITNVTLVSLVGPVSEALMRTHDSTGSDRDLFELVERDPSRVHVFVVDEILGEDSQVYRGLRVGIVGNPCMSYIVLATDVRGLTKTTLAHELGHMFGLSHVDAVHDDNIMKGGRRQEDAQFTRKQLRRIRWGVRRFERQCM